MAEEISLALERRFWLFTVLAGSDVSGVWAKMWIDELYTLQFCRASEERDASGPIFTRPVNMGGKGSLGPRPYVS